MATYTKFNSFVEAMAEKLHNLGSDTLRVALTNSAPSASNTQLSQITEISYANLASNPASRALVVTSSAQSAGTYKLVVDDLLLTASGGNVGPFQYVVIYNDTATNDEVIAWFDLGAATTIVSGNELLLNFDQVNGVVQIT